MRGLVVRWVLLSLACRSFLRLSRLFHDGFLDSLNLRRILGGSVIVAVLLIIVAVFANSDKRMYCQ